MLAREFGWSVPLVVLLGMLMSVLEGLGIGLLIPLFSTLFGREHTGGDAPEFLTALLDAPLRLPERVRLPGTAAIIFGLICLKGVLQVMNARFLGWLDGSAGAHLQIRLHERLLGADYAFYLSHRPARLISILSDDSWHAAFALRRMCDMLAAAASAVVFGALLLVVNWPLFTAIVVVLVTIRGVQSLLTRRIRAAGDVVRADNLRLGDRMYESVDASRVMRLFNRREREAQRFAAAAERVRLASLKVNRLSAYSGPMVEVSYAALFIAVLLAAHASGVGVPVLITFLVLLYRMQPFLVGLEGGWTDLAASRAAVRRVEWLLRLEPARPRGRPEAAEGVGRQDITFEEVGFSYPSASGPPALDGASFTLRAGEITALIGRSGSGKSTVVNLLCGLFRPSQGRIAIGGRDLADVDGEAWLRRIGVAGQDIDLVEGTLRDNIAYGAPEATLEDVREAARLADIAAFIEALPEGYDTAATGRGLSLSGGQRQRIGVARALVRRPALLILDEATSAVDGISERAILDILRLPGLTALVVSHRPGTLAACREGVVLENGRVLEAGPLRELQTYRSMRELEAELAARAAPERLLRV